MSCSQLWLYDRLVGIALGKPVKCVGTTIDQARSALQGMGMPTFVVEIIREQYVAFREGRLELAEPRTPDTTPPRRRASSRATC